MKNKTMQASILEKNKITLLKGPATIDGQIKARKKGLKNCIKAMENPNEDLSISMLKMYAFEHVQMLGKLFNIKHVL